MFSSGRSDSCPSGESVPRARVLIVEDDPVMAEALSGTVAAMGYDDTSVAYTAESARKTLQAEPGTAVILGRWCPEIAEAFSRDYNAVVIGGSRLLVRGGSAIDNSALCYLPKPVQPRQLRFLLQMMAAQFPERLQASANGL